MTKHPLICLVLLSACGVDVDANAPQLPQNDAGLSDAGRADATRHDAGDPAPIDAGDPTPMDAGDPIAPDAGTTDDGGIIEPPDAGEEPLQCRSPFDCPAGQYCNAEGRCVAQDDGDAGVAPVDDHSDQIEGATAVDIGDETEGQLNGPGDLDHFRFVVTEGGFYRIFTSGPTDTFCVLLTADGQTLAENDDGGERFNCLVERRLEPGLYVVRVRHWNRRQTGPYTLHIEGPEDEPQAICGNGQIEPGEQCDDGNRRPGDGCNADCRREGPMPGQDDHSNTGAGATALPLNGRVDGLINWPGDVDYFVFTPHQDGELALGTIGDTDTRCRAESVMGDVIAEDSDSGAGGNCRLSVAVEDGRPVFFRIEGQNEGVVGPFTAYAARP